MIDGRHCIEKDLELLIKETEKVKKSILKNGYEDSVIESFLELISRFDLDVSRRIKEGIDCCYDINKIIAIIDENIESLKQCVVVDIYEHQND